MEVICLEENAFYKLVEDVVERLSPQASEAQAFKWISPEEAMSKLNISSSSTLQKIRDEGKIRFSQPMKRVILYDLDSINEYLEKHAKDPFQ